MDTWEEMEYWKSSDWITIQERLDAMDARGTRYNPDRSNLFAALDSCDLHSVKVAIIGQDPYPQPEYCTGIAFSIPKGCKFYPPTLENIFKEYSSDLGYPRPETGNLESWCKQGVFLWNAYPTCEAYKSLSHMWPEWATLTMEIVEILSDIGVVFVFLGNEARKNVLHCKDIASTDIIELSHPSPRASRASKHPFFGSRLFSTINSKLMEPINWRLP